MQYAAKTDTIKPGGDMRGQDIQNLCKHGNGAERAGRRGTVTLGDTLERGGKHLSPSDSFAAGLTL